MRPCSACVRTNELCVISRESDSCELCVRHHRSCDLAPLSDRELDKLHSEAQRFDDQEAELIAKLARIRRQRRSVLKKLRDLNDREARNILKLEAEEMLLD